MGKKKKKRKELSFAQKMLLMKKSGFSHKGAGYEGTHPPDNPMDELSVRIKKILDISNKPFKATQMLYFIMYDIENDKVRTQIAKYLERNGCLRVQKSIFFAQTERSLFDKIYGDLKEIQEMYENEDSIFLVPVSTDQIQSMKIIGQNIDFSLITGNTNTLFF